MNFKELLDAFDSKLEENRAKAAALKTELSACKDEKRTAEIGDESKKLEEETKSLETQRSQVIAKRDEEIKKAAIFGTVIGGNEIKNSDTAEKRMKDLADKKAIHFSFDETRAVLVSSTSLVKPDGVNQNIHDNYDSIPSLLNDVSIQDATGSGTWKETYKKTNGTASEGTSGTDATESDPTFGFVTITPTYINTVAKVDKNINRLSPIKYMDKVQASVGYAMRDKICSYIPTWLKASKDDAGTSMVEALSLAKGINETSLRDIVLGAHGGDNSILQNCTLYLNKTNLSAFGKIRGTNEKKPIYDIAIEPGNPNAGTIKDGGTIVRYVIVNSLSDTELLYGAPLSFELCQFGTLDVTMDASQDFTKGLIDFMGEASVGGAVIIPNGFAVITVGTGA